MSDSMDLYINLDYRQYKQLEEQVRSWEKRETVHTSVEGFYHKSFSFVIDGVRFEFHGPNVKAGNVPVSAQPIDDPSFSPSGERAHESWLQCNRCGALPPRTRVMWLNRDCHACANGVYVHVTAKDVAQPAPLEPTLSPHSKSERKRLVALGAIPQPNPPEPAQIDSMSLSAQPIVDAHLRAAGITPDDARAERERMAQPDDALALVEDVYRAAQGIVEQAGESIHILDRDARLRQIQAWAYGQRDALNRLAAAIRREREEREALVRYCEHGDKCRTRYGGDRCTCGLAGLLERHP